jgi:putative ABC transport system substrate-binding protein
MWRVLLAVCIAMASQADAQQAGRVYRIGVLEREAADSESFSAFRERMRELGYVEGRNLAFEFRASQGRDDLYPKFAAELVAQKVDLILGRGTPAILAAKRATSTIPIVMLAAGDPVGDGLIASYARPGGSVTGFAGLTTDLSGKRLQILRELFPQIHEIGALMNMGNPNVHGQRREFEAATHELGIRLRVYDVRTAEDLHRAFEDAATQRLRVMYVALDNLTQVNRQLIAELASKHRLPTMNPSKEYAEVGGLASYGPNFPALYRGAANVAERIFKGAKPADIPVQQPTQFELVLNARTAKALKVSIPQRLLVSADKVVE